MSLRILSQRCLRSKLVTAPIHTSSRIPISRPAARLFTTSRSCPADDKPEKPKGPNQDVLPHVSEEAAITGKITGEGGPDLGQGTPVQEVLERDEEAREKAPEVIKQDFENSSKAQMSSSDIDTLRAQIEREAAEYALQQADTTPQHIFPLPESIPATGYNFKRRYDEVINQMTNLMMKDGKKSRAQRNMTFVLNFLRSAPAPKISPNRPLVPDTPPAPFLPLNPVRYLTVALDSLAPLLRMRSVKGQAGGGATLQIPTPLSLRQRRRAAFDWILTVVEKKGSRGSGKNGFAQKVAEEIVAVVEGRSAAWDRRDQLHRTATAMRANINVPKRRK